MFLRKALPACFANSLSFYDSELLGSRDLEFWEDHCTYLLPFTIRITVTILAFLQLSLLVCLLFSDLKVSSMSLIRKYLRLVSVRFQCWGWAPCRSTVSHARSRELNPWHCVVPRGPPEVTLQVLLGEAEMFGGQSLPSGVGMSLTACRWKPASVS